MSSIAGIINITGNPPIKQETLISMLEAMKTDIPYNMETYALPDHSAIVGRIGYGPDRNCISKPDRKENDCRIFFSGELYNDDVVKYDSSADYLLDRYLRLGIDKFAEGLNGSFSAVIADIPHKSVAIVTDHVAAKAIYTATYKGIFYFASEVKAILAVPEFPNQPDLISCLSLLSRGFYFGGRTIVENIKQMDYATVCHIKEGQVHYKPYWRCTVDPGKDQGRKKHLNEFTEILRQAVKRRVKTGRCGIALSGGVDSRGIVILLDKPAEIYAVTFSGRTYQERHKYGDWALSEKITRQLGMKLYIARYDSKEFLEAMKDSAFATEGASSFIYENIWDRIRQDTGIEYLLLGDECLGLSTSKISEARVLSRCGLDSPRMMSEVTSLVRNDRLESLLARTEAELAKIAAHCKAKSASAKILQLYFQERLMHRMNHKRRVIERHGIGVRNPWLDLHVLEYINKVPTRYIINKILFKDAVAHINPKLFKLPRSRETETVNYHSDICRQEDEDKGITTMIFKDNPLIEEIFDINALQTLIDQTCRSDDHIQSRTRFNPLTLMPMTLRSILTTFYKNIMKPVRPVNKVIVLLEVMTLAESLRQLHNRFANIDNNVTA